MSQTTQFSTIADISRAASDAIFKFQTSKVNRDELYSMGVDMSCQFNYLVKNQKVDAKEAETTAGLLLAIKHFSTC